VLLLGLSATGLPMALLALWRLGRFGGLLLEVAIAALGVRAGTMIASGAGHRLRSVPHLLLFVETALDGLAVVTGFWAWVWQPFVRSTPKQSAEPAARTTPVAAGAWLAASVVHTVRMAIYVSPGRGLRADTERDQSSNGPRGRPTAARREGVRTHL
jgi:hypothetical protein